MSDNRHSESGHQRWLRAIRFFSIGLTGLAVDIVCFHWFTSFLAPAASRGLAIWTAMSWNFFLNRRFTFADDSRPAGTQYWRFCSACLLGASVNWIASLLFILAGPASLARVYFAPILGAVCGALANYFMCCNWVFARRRVERESAPALSVFTAPRVETEAIPEAPKGGKYRRAA